MILPTHVSTLVQDDIVHEDLTVLENLMVSAAVQEGRERVGEGEERRGGEGRRRRGGREGARESMEGQGRRGRLY